MLKKKNDPESCTVQPAANTTTFATDLLNLINNSYSTYKQINKRKCLIHLQTPPQAFATPIPNIYTKKRSLNKVNLRRLYLTLTFSLKQHQVKKGLFFFYFPFSPIR
uniref:Uncharacterized protein n=1 Tax=Fundulus heteroclitus TaxID=8078 RepID=A0A3Q2P4I1_FUNHE